MKNTNTPKITGTSAPVTPARRKFLGNALATATIATGVITPAAQAQFPKTLTNSCDDTNFPFGNEPASLASNRYMKAYKCRLSAAKLARERTLVFHQSNGDDARYPNKLASYSKALPHNQLGEVDLAAYGTLTQARETQNPELFEQIKLGGVRKLTNPQAGLAMDLEGPDSHHVTIAPAPRFDSAEAAAEMVELYWMALLRDVNFDEYEKHPLVAAACDELNRLQDFRGPRDNGSVTPQTLFRLNLKGDVEGPWMSQFLVKDFYFGANFITQKMRTVVAGLDYMTKYNDWLAVQNGAATLPPVFESTPVYIRNLRDLSEWVHVDALYQGYLFACLVMLEQNMPLDPGLPLYNAKAQVGFAQCGGPHILSLLAEVATRALKSVWYQKWFVHHRLRPEAFGGRIHNHISQAANYPIHPAVLNSRAVAETFSRTGSYLLPMAFPEGSPTHPSYGAGHATVAGACVTALKAFFDETAIVKNPVVPNADGSALVAYEGEPLTVLGELNKVARNIANGRNGAGVHYLTDSTESLKLGEAITIGILQEQKLTYHDHVEMTLTKFDGTKFTI